MIINTRSELTCYHEAGHIIVVTHFNVLVDQVVFVDKYRATTHLKESVMLTRDQCALVYAAGFGAEHIVSNFDRWGWRSSDKTKFDLLYPNQDTTIVWIETIHKVVAFLINRRTKLDRIANILLMKMSNTVVYRYELELEGGVAC